MPWPKLIALFALCVSVPNVSAQAPPEIFAHQEPARYIGELIFVPLNDGRHMRIQRAFGFVDASGKNWIVPAGAVVDGASIPSAFWSLIGGPFEGKYRDASVIHDYYCDIRTRSWRETDRVFYEAMRVSGVSEREAKVLYMAVVYGGPRWDLQTVRNNLLSSTDAIAKASAELHVRLDRGVSDNPVDGAISAEKPEPTPQPSLSKAKSFKEKIMRSNPTLDQIDRFGLNSQKP